MSIPLVFIDRNFKSKDQSLGYDKKGNKTSCGVKDGNKIIEMITTKDISRFIKEKFLDKEHF